MDIFVDRICVQKNHVLSAPSIFDVAIPARKRLSIMPVVLGNMSLVIITEDPDRFVFMFELQYILL